MNMLKHHRVLHIIDLHYLHYLHYLWKFHHHVARLSLSLLFSHSKETHQASTAISLSLSFPHRTTLPNKGKATANQLLNTYTFEKKKIHAQQFILEQEDRFVVQQAAFLLHQHHHFVTPDPSTEPPHDLIQSE
jgi:hypothetical protein